VGFAGDQDGVVDFTEFVTAFADIPNFASMMAGDSAPEPEGAE
jgi:hypothetical protein